ncbi:hypothetical protein MS5N3_09870 [Marinobacter salsuginis]|uniref:Uncharacterized protein n=1 Tax=Marinobacter salsuginis TaxID=418719 RepID=A0A5M3PLA8_9GAMM|nr:hypothetical protein MS5N3_09870 [Marinobacter salsuginis]
MQGDLATIRRLQPHNYAAHPDNSGVRRLRVHPINPEPYRPTMRRKPQAQPGRRQRNLR